MKNDSTWVKWLFRPFTFIAGTKALILGLIVMALLSILGYVSGTHFDGAIDIHYGPTVGSGLPYIVHAFYQAGGWLLLTVVFYVTARIVSKSSVRLIDMAGTLALSQTPLLLAALWGFAPIAHIDLGNAGALQLDELQKILLDSIHIIWLNAVVVIIPAVWTLILKYNAFSVSSNLKGYKGITVYCIALLIAEILSVIIFRRL